MRHSRPSAGVYMLIAQSPDEVAMLENAARFYRALEGTGVAPRLCQPTASLAIEAIDGRFERTGHLPELAFLWGCVDLLRALRARGIRHGDLTWKNILVRGNRPVACDFQEASFWDEPIPPDHRPEGDAYWLWRAAARITGDQDRRFRRWIAIQDVLEGRVLDLGCGPGHFTVLAALEGHTALGVDRDPEVLRTAWAHRISGAHFEHGDIRDLDALPATADTVLCLSTWAHLVQGERWDPYAATSWLADLVDRYPQVIFETQIADDGPGPHWIKTQQGLKRWLGTFCTAEPLVGLPVWGRRAYRTVWRLT